MNKLVKRSLWGIGILLGLIVIAAAVFVINFVLATQKMTPAETSAINDSVFVVKDRFVNAYIFKGKKSYLMVDAGFSEKNFLAELNKLAIAPEQITTILLTHSDGDHIGSIGLYKNPKIYMHKDEEQMINGQTAKMGPFKTKWKYGTYTLFNSNDTLTIDGLKIKVIHTPGHTPGSVCFVINNDYLLTGDNLIYSNGKYEHFVEKFNMDTPRQIESLKLLPEPKSFRYILTGHHGVTKIR
jgi:glyoxylase-like metal-dependent hydrolase (beta-lactamase superfamily II)